MGRWACRANAEQMLSRTSTCARPLLRRDMLHRLGIILLIDVGVVTSRSRHLPLTLNFTLLSSFALVRIARRVTAAHTHIKCHKHIKCRCALLFGLQTDTWMRGEGLRGYGCRGYGCRGCGCKRIRMRGYACDGNTNNAIAIPEDE